MVKPNILVTGTPGVGKSKICTEIAKKFKYNHLNVSAIAKDNGFVQGHDDEYDCPVIEEDQLLDHLEPIMAAGGNIVEYHSCDFFPERWFHSVYVVRCDNTILFDRLTDRGYSGKKLQSNVECEIFMEILNEAMDSYNNDIVHELRGDSETDFEESIATIGTFLSKSNKTK